MLTVKRCPFSFCVILTLLAGCSSKPQLSVPPSPETTEGNEGLAADVEQEGPAIQVETRWVYSRTNIRADRSTKAPIVGRLEADDSVQVAFLEDEWFAVFALDQEVSADSSAIGFVYAPLLKPAPIGGPTTPAVVSDPEPAVVAAAEGAAKEQAHTSAAGASGILGCWIDEVSMGIQCTLYRKGDRLVLEQRYSDGSISKKEVVERTITSGKRFDPTESSSSGDYYRLNASGVLEFWDKDGLIVKLQECP